MRTGPQPALPMQGYIDGAIRAGEKAAQDASELL